MKYKISERHIRSYTTTSLSEAGGKKKKTAQGFQQTGCDLGRRGDKNARKPEEFFVCDERSLAVRTLSRGSSASPGCEGREQRERGKTTLEYKA